jgi:hypothetical protein
MISANHLLNYAATHPEATIVYKAIDMILHIIKSVVSSAAEAEFGTLFYNAKDGCIVRTTLEDLGHKQPATLIETDNSCAHGIANQNIKRIRSVEKYGLMATMNETENKYLVPPVDQALYPNRLIDEVNKDLRLLISSSHLLKHPHRPCTE